MSQRETITFFVPGRPLPFMRVRHGKGRHWNAPEYDAFKDKVAWAARAAGVLGDPDEDMCWELDVILSPDGLTVTAKPVERIKSGLRGDIDNYAKGVMDALQGVVYKNDKHVSKLTVEHWKG